MKILNLYCGIGGNRKLWSSEHDITAVELDPKIASIYKDFFPGDTVIIADAHEYLLQHYKEFDFIWSSPPCPSHSDIRRMSVDAGCQDAIYPDMQLYQEIILLKHFAPKNCKWVIENVKPYYDLLIEGLERGRHIFWGNFYILPFDQHTPAHHLPIKQAQKVKGFNLDNYTGIDKRKAIRNCVDSKLAKHIFDCAFINKQERLF